MKPFSKKSDTGTPAQPTPPEERGSHQITKFDPEYIFLVKLIKLVTAQGVPPQEVKALAEAYPFVTVDDVGDLTAKIWTLATQKYQIPSDWLISKLPKNASLNKKADLKEFSNKETRDASQYIVSHGNILHVVTGLAQTAQSAPNGEVALASWLKDSLAVMFEDFGIDPALILWDELAWAFYTSIQMGEDTKRKFEGKPPLVEVDIDKLPTLDKPKKIDQLLEQLSTETDPKKKEQIKQHIERIKRAKLIKASSDNCSICGLVMTQKEVDSGEYTCDDCSTNHRKSDLWPSQKETEDMLDHAPGYLAYEYGQDKTADGEFKGSEFSGTDAAPNPLTDIGPWSSPEDHGAKPQKSPFPNTNWLPADDQNLDQQAPSNVAASLNKKAEDEGFWIDPNGKVYTVRNNNTAYQTHDEWVSENRAMLKKDYGITINNTILNNLESKEVNNLLISQGWTRIGDSGRGDIGIRVKDLHKIPSEVENTLYTFYNGGSVALEDLNGKHVEIPQLSEDLQKAVNHTLYSTASLNKQALAQQDVVDFYLMSLIPASYLAKEVTPDHYDGLSVFKTIIESLRNEYIERGMFELIDEAETTKWTKGIRDGDMPEQLKPYYTYHDGPMRGNGDSEDGDYDSDEDNWSCQGCNETIDQDSTFYFHDEPYCETCEGRAVDTALKDEVSYCVTHHIFITDDHYLAENFLKPMGYKVDTEAEHPADGQHEIISYTPGVEAWDEIAANAKNQLRLQFEERKKRREEKQQLPQTNPTEETASLKQAGEGRYTGNDGPGWWEAPTNFNDYSAKDFYTIFKYAPWKHLYGGPLWAEVAKTIGEMQTTTDWEKLVVLIDHFHDLGHNTGKLLDKFPEWHKWFKKLLDMKAQKNSIRYLLPKASKPVQDLVTEYLRVHGKDWRADEQPKKEKPKTDSWNVGDKVFVNTEYGNKKGYSEGTITDIVDPNQYNRPFKIVLDSNASEFWVSADELKSPQFSSSSLNRPFSKIANPPSRFWLAPDGTEFATGSAGHGAWIKLNADLLKKYGIDTKNKQIGQIHEEMIDSGWVRVSNEPAGTGFVIEVQNPFSIPSFLDDFVAKNFMDGDTVVIGNAKHGGFISLTDPFPSLEKAIRKASRHASLKQAAINSQITNVILQLIHDNGGVTYNIAQGNMAGTPNFSVSIYPDREKVEEGGVDFERLEGYLEDNEDLLNDPNNSFGAWTNDGKMYLDVVVTLPDQAKAIELAKQHNQIAIWDLLNSREIPTGGTGGGNKVASVEMLETNFGPDIKLLRNPTINEAIALLNKSEYHSLRFGTSDPDLWMWDAGALQHEDAAQGLGLEDFERRGEVTTPEEVQKVVRKYGFVRAFSKKSLIKIAEESLLCQEDQNEIAAASSPVYVIAVNNYAEALKRGHSKDRSLEYAIESVQNLAKVDPKKVVEFINKYVPN